jgi:hypothetical protein
MALRHDDANNVTDTPLFRLYLQTKLTNPHYTPELQAQTTLVNFTVTERGLEDQLLALVVNKERPDLEEQRAELVEQQNQFTIKLKQLEDDLLHRLATAEGDILGDEELIISLEVTKATVIEISEKVGVAKATSLKINQARETYRPVAARGSLIYFLVDTLNVIDHMYQFSLAAFNFIYSKVPQHPARRVSPRLSAPLHATSRHPTRHATLAAPAVLAALAMPYATPPCPPASKALDKAKASDPSYAQQFPQEALEERTLALLDSATITCFSYVTHRSMCWRRPPARWRHSWAPWAAWHAGSWV